MTKPITETEQYKNLLVIVTGLLVLGSIAANVYLIATALVVGVVSLVIPVAGKYIVIGWMKLAEVLGWINGRIILSLIFFVFLVPIALLSRIGNKNPLQLKKESGSMFRERNHTYGKKDLKNVW